MPARVGLFKRKRGDFICFGWPGVAFPAYEGKLRVKERKRPKLYWVDSGVVRAVKREFHPPGEAERGALLEGWVGALLKAYGEPGCGFGLQSSVLG